MFSETGATKSSVQPDCSDHTCCFVPYLDCHNSASLFPWDIHKWIHSGSDLFLFPLRTVVESLVLQICKHLYVNADVIPDFTRFPCFHQPSANPFPDPVQARSLRLFGQLKIPLTEKPSRIPRRQPTVRTIPAVDTFHKPMKVLTQKVREYTIHMIPFSRL